MARVLLPPEEVVDDNYTLLRETEEEALMARVLLPPEIIFNILSRLPVKPLIRFRCVCKSWCDDLFRNPSFIKMQIKHANEKENSSSSSMIMHDYRVDAFFIIMIYKGEEIHHLSDTEMLCRYPFRGSESEVTVFGSCNGVLCLKVTDHRWHFDYICLWNPITKEFDELPRGDFQPDPLEGADSKVEEIYGFGCDCNLEDYKVVSVTYNHGDNNTEGDLSSGSEVNVYTVGSDSWRRIQDLPYDLTYEKIPGVHVNGAIHWVAYRNCGRKKNEKIILSLDLGNEEYREVPQPVYKARTFELNVGALEGCLCIVCNVGGKRVDVWMMKDYGVRESWTKILTIGKRKDIHFFTDMIPMKILKNGDILFIDGNENDLLSYDPKKRMVKSNGFNGCVEPFVGSLVSLKSGRHVRLENKKKRKRKRKRKNSDSVNSATSHELEPRWWETHEDYDNDFMDTMTDESDDCFRHC